jgi:hypothetical protein
MKKEEIIIHAFWMMFGIIVAVLGYSTMRSYLDARVEYEQISCADSAYMIWKKYDDQPNDIRSKDWSSRGDECVKVEAKYTSAAWW